MKDSFKTGLSATRTITVDDARAIGFMGDDCRVYATPSLVSDIEYACRDLAFAHSDKDEDSVGVNVSITHMAPTLIGMEAEITVTVSVYEKRRVVFDITAKDTLDTICKGTHERFIVDVNQTRERLKAKAAKAKALEG